MAHLNAAVSPENICLDFSCGDTVDIEMKEIGRRRIPSRDLSDSHFPLSLYCASDSFAYSESSSCKSTSPIPYLDDSVLM